MVVNGPKTNDNNDCPNRENDYTKNNVSKQSVDERLFLILGHHCPT